MVMQTPSPQAVRGDEWRKRRPEAVVAEAQARISADNTWTEERRAHWRVQQAHEHEWAVPVTRVLQYVPPTTVLDVGCGYGTLAVVANMLGHAVTAVDLFVENPGVQGPQWLRADVQVPGALPAGPFGIVVMTEVLEHLSVHPAGVLAEIAARMAPWAWFLGSSPDPAVWADVPPRTPDEMPQRTDEHQHVDAHVCFYSPATVTDLLRAQGMSMLGLFSVGASRARYFWMAKGRGYECECS